VAQGLGLGVSVFLPGHLIGLIVIVSSNHRIQDKKILQVCVGGTSDAVTDEMGDAVREWECDNLGEDEATVQCRTGKRGLE